MTITVYTTSSCVQCTATKKKLNQLGIRYTEIPVTDQIAEELRTNGFTGLPVVATDTSSWQGFRPDKIREIATYVVAQ